MPKTHPRILDVDDGERPDGDYIVTLAHGWAFDPDDDESAASHVKSFPTIRAANSGAAKALPCTCGRCRSAT